MFGKFSEKIWKNYDKGLFFFGILGIVSVKKIVKILVFYCITTDKQPQTSFYSDIDWSERKYYMLDYNGTTYITYMENAEIMKYYSLYIRILPVINGITTSEFFFHYFIYFVISGFKIVKFKNSFSYKFAFYIII